MTRLSLPFALLLSSILVNACGDDAHSHSHTKRSTNAIALPPPSRPLEWGDINIIHTTDSHGWLLGHQKQTFPEPNASGNLGDFSSFISHMKSLALKKDVDLLVVDSGDLHDGTGLTDGFPVGGVDAHDANEFIKKIPYDVMAIGNHELYVYNNTLDMYKNFAPALKGRYLSSNVNITVTDPKTNKTTNTPVGSRFSKFKTRKGRKVTALGVLFDFAGNDKGTTVQHVADMVKEKWFADAIKEEPDFFLLAGHMPIAKDNWPVVFDAIRKVHPSTPILIFGGHTHIRDCNQLDGRSMSLESGRYMETVGWMSVKLDHHSKHPKNLTFSRRYLDPNRVTYAYHTQGNHGHYHPTSSFDTSLGKSITSGLKALSKRFNLDSVFGTAQNDYYISAVPYPSNTSLLSLFINQATPYALAQNNTRVQTDKVPNIIIANSGSQRFDLFKGPFTRNDQFTVSPFEDKFLVVKDVEFDVASGVLDALNNAGAANRRRDVNDDWKTRMRKELDDYEVVYKKWMLEMSQQSSSSLGESRLKASNLTTGYVTKDSCPGLGDDVPHTPPPQFQIPDFIASSFPTVDSTGNPITNKTKIDLVFVDFIENQLLGILNDLAKAKGADKTDYGVGDVEQYGSFATNQVLGVYAQGNWN